MRSPTSTPTSQRPKSKPAVSNPAEGAYFDILIPFQKQLVAFLGAGDFSRTHQQRASRLLQMLTCQKLRLKLSVIKCLCFNEAIFIKKEKRIQSPGRSQGILEEILLSNQ